MLGFGADVFIDYRSEDFQTLVAQATSGKGVDIVIDFVGAPTWSPMCDRWPSAGAW